MTDYVGKKVRYKAGRFVGVGTVTHQGLARVKIETSKGKTITRNVASLLGLAEEAPEPAPTHTMNPPV